MADSNEVPSTAVENSAFSGLFVAPTAAELDEILEQFEVIELIGQGGMGAVYKARQPRLDRYVAIKLLPAFAKGDSHQYGERFEREARAMAHLNHPNVVTVHDFGETEDGHRYIVMEYVEGADLHSLIHGGKLTTKHALAWIPLICSALDYAHEKGIVHRDIKPANILISNEGDVKVSDFGLAKLMGKKYQNAITQTQVSMGTPDYAAPEALEEGAEVDRRADVYSLGVLFYELLTGKVPRGAWRPPSAFMDVDVRVDQIIVKAMQPDPNHRYQTVGKITEALNEMRHAPKKAGPKLVTGMAKPLLTGAVKLPSKKELEQLLTESPRASTRPGSHTSFAASSVGANSGKMNPAVVGVIALGGMLLVIGAILLIVSSGSNRSRPTPTPPTVITPNPPTDPSNTAPIVDVPIVEPGPGQGPGPRSKGKGKGKGKGDGPRMRPLEPREGRVDLLADLDMGASTGTWNRRNGGGLKLEQAPNKPGLAGRGWMPFPVGPGQVYELQLDLEPTEIRPIAVHLPVGHSSVLFLFGVNERRGESAGPLFAGLGQVDGVEAFLPKNPTRTKLDFAPGESLKLEIRVVARGRRAGIIVQREGVDVIRWSGNIDQLSVRDPSTGIGGRRVAIGSQAPLLVKAASIRALPKVAQIPVEPLEPEDTRPWIDALAALNVEEGTITGDWSLEGAVLRAPAAADPSARPRVELPLVPRGSYEIEVRFQTEAEGDVVFLLPVDGEHYAPLHLAAGGDTLGLDLAGKPLSSVGNPTAMASPVEAGKDHLGLIQVRGKGEAVRITMHVDGTPVFNWNGSPGDLPTDLDWPPRDKTRITLGSLAAVRFDFIRIRGVDPKSVPDMPTTSPELEGVQLRLTEIEGKFDEELKGKAEENFVTRVGELNEQYNAALNNLIADAETASDLPLKDATEREKARLRDNNPIEAIDPPEMPASLKARRGVYRTELRKREEERDRLSLPILREHLAAVEALSAEYAQLENPAAVMFIAKKRSELEDRILELLKSVGAAGDAEAAPVSPPTAALPMIEVLSRPEFPRQPPEERGEVIAFTRKPDATPAATRMGEIPGGLTTTAVAIAGWVDVVVALKANGRVELWGELGELAPQSIEDLESVAHIALARSIDELHVAWLTEDGELSFYSYGWGADSIDTFRTQAASIPEPVDLFVGPAGGLAVQADGTIGFWGKVGAASGGVELENIVKIVGGPGVGVGLQADGTLKAFGPGAAAVIAQASKARDVAFGTQPETGAIALLPDRKVKAFGSFAEYQTAVDALDGAERIVTGYYGFAIDTGAGDWHFFGQNLDADHCAEQARGCSDLVIGRDYIIGLRPK